MNEKLLPEVAIVQSPFLGRLCI